MADEHTGQHLELIDAIPILHESFELAKRKTKKKVDNFRFDCSIEECFVRANVLLKDVFLNVFDNSIKYSDDTPQISVVIDEVTQNRESWCRISVTYHGSGIKPDRRGRMFERYMEDAVGTGLGLSVVRTLVQAYGGSVSIEERIHGDHTKGTIFRILLRMR
ncbi:MAG: sensor histidine kinase [Candidatus Thorarchaeota archaeon]